MKHKFNEYYKLDSVELKEHWSKDTFCFDANVLLNLYRYTPKTRNAFLGLFEKIRDRIWIPYQAAMEYQRNRLFVINAQKEAYPEIRKTLEKKKSEIEAKLNGFKKHPYLRTDELKIQIKSAFKAISNDLNKLEENHPDYLSKDPIWDKLTELLENKIGDDLKTQPLEELYKKGKKRYKEKIPPGYMDFKEKKNEADRILYGDLIIWEQIIEKAKEIDESIILITDDLKEDWWYRFKGKTISPRPELLKEFKIQTKKRINVYQADSFLEFANKNLQQKTTPEIIEEVRKVRLADEQEIEELALSEKQLSIENPNSNQKINKSSFEKAIEDSIDRNKKGRINE